MTIDLPKEPIRRASSHKRHQSVVPAPRPGRVALPLITLLAVIGWGLYLHEATRAPSDQTFSTQRPPADSSPNELETVSVAGATAPQDSTIPNDVSPFVTTSDPGSLPATTPAPIEGSQTAVSARDVSGSWMLLTRAERSSYSDVSGSRFGYELHLEQAGDRVTGSARKMTENSRAMMESTAQTPISVEGIVQGNRLTLTYSERGGRRLTQGKFVLLLDEDGTMRGRFSSNATQSAGSVEAYRTP